MAGRAKWMLVTLAALPLGLTAARAQNSEYDTLPRPAASALAAPPAAPAVSAKPAQKSAAELAAERKATSEKAAEEKKAAVEKEKAEKKAAALPAEKESPEVKKQGAAPNAKQDSKEKEEDVQLGHRMAPSAAIPPWPGDEKGPKTIDFLGACPGNFDRCMDQVREIGEKISAAELCIPQDLYFATVTDRVRKWATLRPDVHGLPAERVIAAALRSIYPCKQTPPARTAAEKVAPKPAKTAQ